MSSTRNYKLTAGADVWYFNAEWEYPNHPRPAIVTGPGANPGTVCVTIFPNASLDVIGGKHPPIVVRKNLRVYAIHPEAYTEPHTEFVVVPALQMAAAPRPEWCNPIACSIPMPAELGGEAELPERQEQSPPTVGEARLDDDSGDREEPPALDADALLTSHPAFGREIGPLLDEGAKYAIKPAEGMVLSNKSGAVVCAMKYAAAGPKPHGYRLRAQIDAGKKTLTTVMAGVESERDVGKMILRASQMLSAALNSKGKMDIAKHVRGVVESWPSR